MDTYQKTKIEEKYKFTLELEIKNELIIAKDKEIE